MSKIENTDGMIDQVEESGDGEWLDKYKTIKLPFEYTSKKNHQVVFEYLTEESLPVMYEIIQRVGKDAEGINPEDFHPLEKLRRTVLPSIKKKLAFQSKLSLYLYWLIEEYVKQLNSCAYLCDAKQVTKVLNYNK